MRKQIEMVNLDSQSQLLQIITQTESTWPDVLFIMWIDYSLLINHIKMLLLHVIAIFISFGLHHSSIHHLAWSISIPYIVVYRSQVLWYSNNKIKLNIYGEIYRKTYVYSLFLLFFTELHEIVWFYIIYYNLTFRKTWNYLLSLNPWRKLKHGFKYKIFRIYTSSSIQTWAMHELWILILIWSSPQYSMHLAILHTSHSLCMHHAHEFPWYLKFLSWTKFEVSHNNY
jgi:hypothetical protein